MGCLHINWFQTGGTNPTYGFSTREELDADFRFPSPVVPPMVYRAFESENLEL